MSSVSGSAANTSDEDLSTLPARLRTVVATHLKVRPDVLRPETKLGDDLCMDSLAAAELLVAIEDDLHIVVLSEVLADRDEVTYADLEKIVQEQATATD